MLAAASVVAVLAAFGLLIVLGNRRRAATGDTAATRAASARADATQASARAWSNQSHLRNNAGPTV